MERGPQRLTVTWIDSVVTEFLCEIMKYPQYESHTTSNAKSSVFLSWRYEGVVYKNVDTDYGQKLFVLLFHGKYKYVTVIY